MIQLSSYYHVFIVEAVCNEVDATDDGCFTPRHNIISRKMIPVVPAGVQHSWLLTVLLYTAGSYFIRTGARNNVFVFFLTTHYTLLIRYKC